MKDWNTKLSRGDMIQNIEIDNNHTEGQNDQLIHHLLLYKIIVFFTQLGEDQRRML